MSREAEGYREQIALIRQRYPEKEIYDINEVIALVGKSRNFVKKHLMHDCKNICTSRLALRLCHLS